MPGLLNQLIQDAAQSIRGIGAGNPRFEAELLLAQALGRPRIFLFTHPEYLPSEEERNFFDELLGRRLSGEPLQYVLGTAAFRDLILKVSPGVLIPRSETEILVEFAWEALRRRKPGADRIPERKPSVIDVGVGSGAILLALVLEAIRGGTERSGELWFQPIGIDLSPVALRVTAENARENDLPCPHLLRGDLLSAIDPERQVAAIISNPPYITTSEIPKLPPEIRDHEPRLALQGGPDGLDVIRELLDQAMGFLMRGALLCLEMGADQEQAVRTELERRGLLGLTTIHPDLAGRPRVVVVDPPLDAIGAF